MKKNKTQKGITLIALIITVVLLLILIGVAISSIINDSIYQYSKDAPNVYNKGVQNEQDKLQEYGNYFNKHTGILDGED